MYVYIRELEFPKSFLVHSSTQHMRVCWSSTVILRISYLQLPISFVQAYLRKVMQRRLQICWLIITAQNTSTVSAFPLGPLSFWSEILEQRSTNHYFWYLPKTGIVKTRVFRTNLNFLIHVIWLIALLRWISKSHSLNAMDPYEEWRVYNGLSLHLDACQWDKSPRCWQSCPIDGIVVQDFP